jgi:uncharacterized protein YodC (DUF2158 family)
MAAAGLFCLKGGGPRMIVFAPVDSTAGAAISEG